MRRLALHSIVPYEGHHSSTGLRIEQQCPALPISKQATQSFRRRQAYRLRLALLTIFAVTLWRVVMLYFNTTDLFVDEAQYWFWGAEPRFRLLFQAADDRLGHQALRTRLARSNSTFWIRLSAPLFHMTTALVLMRASRFGSREIASPGSASPSPRCPPCHCPPRLSRPTRCRILFVRSRSGPSSGSASERPHGGAHPRHQPRPGISHEILRALHAARRRGRDDHACICAGCMARVIIAAIAGAIVVSRQSFVEPVARYRDRPPYRGHRTLGWRRQRRRHPVPSAQRAGIPGCPVRRRRACYFLRDAMGDTACFAGRAARWKRCSSGSLSRSSR